MKKITIVFLLFHFLLIIPRISEAQKQYGKSFKNVPDPKDVAIYQVNIRAFSADGNLKGVTARLDSIKALGFNVIYLMPIYPVGKLKSVNSPYCVRDYLAVNEEFGTLQDLRDLVEGAHQRDIAVILDWVANHTSFDNPWAIAHKSWYLQDEKGDILSPPGKPWTDVAQLNFNNQDMRKALIDAMKYWVLQANVDGYRCDFSDGPPFDFWKQALAELKSIKSHKLLLLSEGSRLDHYAAGFDYNFGFRFFENMKTIYEHDGSALTIDSLNVSDYRGTNGDQQIVRYTTNHDVNGSDGTPLELFGGQKGSMAAFVIVAYMKSIPMLYNGQEVGTPYRLTFPFTEKNIDWSLNPDITAEYKKVMALRNASEAIRRGQLTSYSTDDICAFTKVAGEQEVLVLSNVRDKAVKYTTPEKLANTKWKDAFTGDYVKLDKTIELQPYSYHVFRK